MVRLPRKRPKVGWSCNCVLDALAGDSEGMTWCEVCGTSIRWIHLLEHVDYDRSIEVGCCCARKMCQGYDASGAERDAKGLLSRRRRFVESPKWKPSKNNGNNVWRRVKTASCGDITVTIFAKGSRFSVYLAAAGGDKFCDGKTFDTVKQAVSHAFDLVEKLDA